MKNKFVEREYKKAKEYRKKRRNDGSGYHVYHCYKDEDGNLLKDKGYWDDVGVFKGSIYTCILWTHPRYEFDGHIRDKAVDRYDSFNSKKMFDNDNFIKNYKRVGKSRKKVAYFTMNHSPDVGAERKSFADAFNEELATTTHIQRCSIKVSFKKNIRYIHVCYPIEVISEESLIQMADEVMGYYRNYNAFYEKYGEYTYTVDDYHRENDTKPKGDRV